MDHVKLMELEMLIKFRDIGGKIEAKDFEKTFPDNTAEWRAIHFGLEKDDYISFSFSNNPNGSTTKIMVLVEKGRLRIKQLEQEKVEEAIARKESGKIEKDTSSVTNWTKVIGWGTIVLIGLTIYLIYLQYSPPRTSEPYSKGMDSVQRAKFQQRIDSLAKIATDTIYQDSGDEVHDPLPPEIKIKSDSLK